MKIKLNKIHLAIAILLLIAEVSIAFYLKTGFIRHTVGDFLVIILIYSFFKSFLEVNSFKLTLAVLLFAFIIEFLQLTNYLDMFNLQDNYLAKLILGSTFHLSDLVAYSLGAITIIIFEYNIYKLWIT